MHVQSSRFTVRGVSAWLLLCAGGAAAVPPPLDVTSLSGRPAADIAAVVTGCDVQVLDARIVGTGAAFGFFTGGQDIIGFDQGLIISSGFATAVTGPNTSDSTGGSGGANGDPQLDAMSGKTTRDAAILEFDFIPSSTQVSFDYVFGSEEYNEWVNSAFNDVFAFWLNGINVAVVPGTTEFVTINNVNNGYGDPIPCGGGTSPANAAYYLDNAIGSATLCDPVGSATRFWGTQLDGLTVVFTVTATVTAGIINRIRFAIADATDTAYDSAVFIRAGSFTSGGNCPGTTGMTGIQPAAGSAGTPFAAFPNPFRPASAAGFAATTMTIRGLSPGATVRIHAAGGRLVAELSDPDLDGVAVWDVRDRDGAVVPSGVYVILATAPDGSTRQLRAVVVR